VKNSRTHLWLLIVAVAICGAAITGIRSGIDIGRAQYHNDYVRPIQLMASDLVRKINEENLEHSSFLALKVQAAASSAGDNSKFSNVLNARTTSEIETSGVFTATVCFTKDPNTKLTVEVSPDDRFLVDGVEFSEAQLTVIAREIFAHGERVTLHVRARRDVTTASIRKVVKAAAKGGLTDVIFGVIRDDEAK